METTMKRPSAPRWDLDSIFPGGSGSPEFKQFRTKLNESLSIAEREIKDLPHKLNTESEETWKNFLIKLQTLLEEIELVMGLSGCLVSQDVNDDEASAIMSEGDILFARWEKLRTAVESLMLTQDDSAWDSLISFEELKPISFYLNELRRQAKDKMSSEMESLALELAVNGYHAWNRLYDKMAADLRVEFTDNGKTETLSLGQLAPKGSDPRREIRAQAFEKMEAAWETRADLAAMTLNAQAGFRLDLYARRGWDTPLHEPLEMARLKKESLDRMWSVVASESHRLQPYIEAKKRILKIDRFRWYDEWAPCGAVDKRYSYDEAADFIVKHVSAFSTDMADFYRMAIDKKWIEAEDRAGKRGGGFCTGVGPSRQSRIFMTYTGSYENLLTLAHELGHAYHSYVLRDKPFFATMYPMTLAETASIFSELLVTDAARKTASDPKEKLMLLDQSLQAAYIMFCNLQARYLFDCSFYAERKDGTISRGRLDELMVAAQKKAYGSLLDESGYHPLFWASKLHFFITDTPFYNYPYTFGYLFAGGVYDRAKKVGSSFSNDYRTLLSDTGSMTTDNVANKHLGADLGTDSFWKDSVDRVLADVDEFVKLSGEIYR